MDIILFYIGLIIFCALCYCISQVKALSRQIADLKKD